MNIKHWIACASLSLAGLAAHASIVVLGPSPGDPSVMTASFSSNVNGSFFDTFTFDPASVAGEVSISLVPASGSVNFFTALLDGQGFPYLPEGGSSSFTFTALVTADQPLELDVFGFAGDATTLTPADASYDGTVSVSSVPEPTALLLLLSGLVVVRGFASRRRRPALV